MQMDDVRTIVLKVGTGYLFDVDDKGYLSLENDNWNGIVEEVSMLSHDHIVPVVSSGAIRMHLFKKKIPEIKRTIEEKARLSGKGQPHLMAEYINRFEEYERDCAQGLVTKYDFENELSRDNIKNQQKRYFEEGTICIYNENDLIATDEIKFGDNDGLATELAKCIGADLVVMFSDPSKNLGTGGGNSKGKAQKELSDAGIPLEILNGRYEFSNDKHTSKYEPKIRNVLEKYST